MYSFIQFRPQIFIDCFQQSRCCYLLHMDFCLLACWLSSGSHLTSRFSLTHGSLENHITNSYTPLLWETEVREHF